MLLLLLLEVMLGTMLHVVRQIHISDQQLQKMT